MLKRLTLVVILTVGLLGVFGEGVSWAGGTGVTDETIVPLSGERVGRSNVAAADFDGDGDKEIVVGGQDGMLYVVARENGTWKVVWSKQTADDLNAAGAPSGDPCVTTRSDIHSSPAIGDLDGDGHLEIVVTTGGDPAEHKNGGVLVYRYNSPWSFSVMPGWPQPKQDVIGSGPGASDPDGCWDGIWASPALGDLDGDGDLEVIVEGLDRGLHVWHHTGEDVEGWPIEWPDIYRGGWATPAVADLDRDGLPEVIFATDNHPPGSAPPYLLYAFNGDGSLLPGFPVETEQNIVSSPAVGDIDGDGWLDIVVGTGGTYEAGKGNKVYAWDHLGNALPGWPRTTGGNMAASPALGDLDGDGDLEVVIGCGTEVDPSCNWLYAWHGDGTSVEGFPVSPPNNSWTGDSAQGLPYPPILADYDGDGNVEILLVHLGSFGIAAVGNDGQSENDPALKTRFTLSSVPLVDDVDGDGLQEVVIGGAYEESTASNGAVYIWDVTGNADDALPWPMFHHDIARTGRYPAPPRLVFPDEIRAYHQYGSGETEAVYAVVRNGGEGTFDWTITHSITRLRVVPSAGTVQTTTAVRLVITTTGLLTGWHDLGTLTVTGQTNGGDVENSPWIATLTLYVGDVGRVHLPLVMRRY